MRRSLYWLLILAMLLLTAACRQDAGPARPSPVDPAADAETYRSLAQHLSWNGNLHYQNFVIYADDAWFLSTEDKHIARLDPESSTLEKMNSHLGFQFAAYDNWLFYSAGHLNTTVRKIMTDATNSVRISTFPYQYLIADADHLFGILTATGQVMRMAHDGTGRRSLFDGFASEIIYDGVDLYVCSASDTTGLVRINPQDGTSERLLPRRITSLNKVGDRFYFINPADQHRVNLWRADTQQEYRVTSFSLTRPFIIHDSWLYYLDSARQNRLVRLPLKGDGADEERLEIVVDDAVDAFVILPDALYYRRPAGNRTYRVPLPEGTPVRIS